MQHGTIFSNSTPEPDTIRMSNAPEVLTRIPEIPFMKKIGFLSFGHWSNGYGSQVRTAQDSLKQAVELAVAAEEIGIDGAFFRVHHFANQQMSPFPLLAAIAARTSRIEMGTGVIDMRYETPLYMAEEAAATDLLADGRLQLGISRGSPETVDRGYRFFGHIPEDGQDADMARAHTTEFLRAISGERFAPQNPQQSRNPGLLGITPQSPTLRERIWWGAGSRDTAIWAAQQGMQLMSSTLLLEEKGIPFDQLQLDQIQGFLETWKEMGWAHAPQVSVSRSIMPIVDDLTRAYFGTDRNEDTVGIIDGAISRFGRTYAAEPEVLVEQLRNDAAIAASDMLLVTVPNQLGVEFNARQLAVIDQIGKELGWRD